MNPHKMFGRLTSIITAPISSAPRLRGMTKAEREAKRAARKVEHDTALTLAWPAVRRPRCPVGVLRNDARNKLTANVVRLSRDGFGKHKIAARLGVSWRRVKTILDRIEEPRLHPHERRALARQA